jgi:hypothetical protein
MQLHCHIFIHFYNLTNMPTYTHSPIHTYMHAYIDIMYVYIRVYTHSILINKCMYCTLAMPVEIQRESKVYTFFYGAPLSYLAVDWTEIFISWEILFIPFFYDASCLLDIPVPNFRDEKTIIFSWLFFICHFYDIHSIWEKLTVVYFGYSCD